MKTQEQLPLQMSERVEKALKDGRAVLALESTVLTHGLPTPRNFEVLEHLEQTARDNGVEPATIIVLDGKLKIGMDEADKETLQAKLLNKEPVHKLGRRDLPLALAQGISGGTTVSATMLLAHLSGIKVFATGGIGGVHRGWDSTLDISNDLPTLAQIPVIVVSAGCKAILDIPATLEYLETNGVPVLGWRTTDFPAFYSSNSGHVIDRVDNPDQVAEIYRNLLSLDPVSKGILIANPVPLKDQITSKEIEKHIEKAIQEANKLEIGGKQLTPFLLSYLADSTSGRSIDTNLALLINNVIVGSQIARELL
jgi:pseudouridine-5'-phosphate glycosidase